MTTISFEKSQFAFLNAVAASEAANFTLHCPGASDFIHFFQVEVTVSGSKHRAAVDLYVTVCAFEGLSRIRRLVSPYGVSNQ